MSIDFNENKQKVKITQLHKKEEEDLAIILARKYDISYADLTRLPVSTNALRLIPEERAR